MKVHIKHENSGISDTQKEVLEEFINFHQQKVPLKKDIKIIFTSDRVGNMTTGVRYKNGILKILSLDRMFIDILRTLSHEWIHQYQHESLDMDFSQDIGGKAENMANTESGKILKIFQKEFPQHLGVLYQ